MKTIKENLNLYSWGEKCSGWHLVKTDALSIIQELMPPGTNEQRHLHNLAQQFFHILKGEATFDLNDEQIVVSKGEGLHIQPNTKHRVLNLGSENLEFLLISQPSTRNDRIIEPFDESLGFTLNNKMFKSIDNSPTGEVTSDTIFHYRQDNDIIWATYLGGEIKFGTLSGNLMENNIVFTYQHQNLSGDFMTGKCKSTIEIVKGKIRLHEEWQWTCGDYSNGKSVLDEV